MRVYLNCPFADKDDAKACGAHWDPEKRQWFIETEQRAPAQFAKWLPRQHPHADNVNPPPILAQQHRRMALMPAPLWPEPTRYRRFTNSPIKDNGYRLKREKRP